MAEIRLRQSIRNLLKEHPSQISSRSDLKRRSGTFWRGRPNKKKNNNNKNNMS